MLRSIFPSSSHLQASACRLVRQLFPRAQGMETRSLASDTCQGSVIRRVIELGSGSVKSMVAEVSHFGAAPPQIRILSSQNATVLFMKDLKSRESRSQPINQLDFSEEIMAEARDVLESFLCDSNQLKPQATLVVATEAFRQAANGSAFANSLAQLFKVQLQVLSAEEEAKLGFNAALARCKSIDVGCDSSSSSAGIHRDADPSELVVWDCGAGSFQLSTLEQGYHVDSHGSGTAAAQAALVAAKMLADGDIDIADCFETTRHRLFAEHLLRRIAGDLEPAPESFLKFVSSHPVIAIGSQHSLFNQQKMLCGKSTFTLRDVQESIAEVTATPRSQWVQLELERSRQHGEREDWDEVRCAGNAAYMLPKLVLLFAVMQHFHISNVTFFKTKGLCEAVLMQEALWMQS
eukprot:INCI817.1.p1 GENE.INCI817.1~~INCI817.1.p1  ORF type:complete len:406 (+),score=74.24 INCI817.1:408-1625(+)